MLLLEILIGDSLIDRSFYNFDVQSGMFYLKKWFKQNEKKELYLLKNLIIEEFFFINIIYHMSTSSLRMKDYITVLCSQRQITSEEIASMLLEKMREIAEDCLG